VIVVPLLLAPLVVAAASLVERRFGATAAGWMAALPISFTVAVVAVSLDAGPETASAMALSAAAHVPAQVVFGVAFAAVLLRRGASAGLVAGGLAYVATSIVLGDVPVVVAVPAAIALLAWAPRLMARGTPPRGSRPRWVTTALACAAAPVVVGGAIITSRLAGPELAGAVAAFPSVSTAVALAIIASDGRLAGAHALAGLIRSLPCYLSFCLVVGLAVPAAGLAAVALGLLACLAAAGGTFRRVPTTA
jgi:hypothetical protein